MSTDEISDDDGWLTYDFYARDENAAAISKLAGLAAALNQDIDISMPDLAHIEIPRTFGDSWMRAFQRERWALSRKYGDKLSSLFVLASREYAYAISEAAAFLVATDAPVPLRRGAAGLDLARIGFGATDQDPNPTRPNIEPLSSPEGYANFYGWALALLRSLRTVERATELSKDLPFDVPPPSEDIVLAMSIIWFFHAELVYANDTDRAMQLLFEAADARTLGTVAENERLGEEFHGIKDDMRKSQAATERNKSRHRGKYEAESKVLREWEKNPSHFSSAEKAGSHYARWLASEGIEYEPRTVTSWIRAHAKAKGIKFR